MLLGLGLQLKLEKKYHSRCKYAFGIIECQLCCSDHADDFSDDG